MALGQDRTIGPAQIKASFVKGLVNKYPDLQDMKDDFLRKSFLPAARKPVNNLAVTSPLRGFHPITLLYLPLTTFSQYFV